MLHNHTFDNGDDHDDHDDDFWGDLFDIRVYQRASESLSHQYPAPHWVYHPTFCDDYIALLLGAIVLIGMKYEL